jgi:hypothetical protein
MRAVFLPLRLGVNSLCRPGPLPANLLRQPPICSLAKTTKASAARVVDGHSVDLGLHKEQQASVDSFSEFVGVARKTPKSNIWISQICVEGKKFRMGFFSSEEEAAHAYDERAATQGRPVNFPKEGQEQAVKRGSSKYRGVTKYRNGWNARINLDGEMKSLGTFDSEEAAARKFDEAAAPLGRKLNFPVAEGQGQAAEKKTSEYEAVLWEADDNLRVAVGAKNGERLPLGCFKSEEVMARAVDDHLVDQGLPRKHFPEKGELRQASVDQASDFVGVKRGTNNKRWVAQITIKGKSYRLGSFGSEEKAARAYDERAAALGRPVNYPKEGQEQAVKKSSPKYRGVTKVGKRWKAQIGIQRYAKTKNLGTFDSEEEAARKFDEAAAILGRKLNFQLSKGPVRSGGAPS